jgi:hypothetical protein
MLPQAERFDRWLRRRSPHAATPAHYLNDLKLFLAWAGKAPKAITLHDVDLNLRDVGTLIVVPSPRPACIP